MPGITTTPRDSGLSSHPGEEEEEQEQERMGTLPHRVNINDQDGIPNDETTPGIDSTSSSMPPPLTATTATTATWLDEYRRECAKARARAAKFGTEYREPSLESFAPTWSELKRVQNLLRLSSQGAEKGHEVALDLAPAVGFATGIDLDSPDEADKQQARRARFAAKAESAEGSATVATASATKSDADKADDGGEAEAGSASASTADAPGREESVAVAVEEAWDNDDNVHQFRIDPPTTTTTTTSPTTAPLAEDKVHVFSIDWAPFKQVRSDDLLHYFALYGPTYVEWLSDLSANVVFRDQFSAKRALRNLSTELPSPPPQTMAAAATDPDDDPSRPPLERLSTDVDLGGMGWRIGTTLLVKRSNDRHGRKGTRARVLMRAATSLDFLQDRPNTWPAPPRRSTNQRVLVPLRHHYRRRRLQNRKSRDAATGSTKRPRPLDEDNATPTTTRAAAANTSAWDMSTGGEHPMLSRGLSSGRGSRSRAHTLGNNGEAADVDAATAERSTKRFKRADNDDNNHKAA